ncbi:MAG: hypothetical protein ACRDE5_14355, partial [Ginsengibacter sp.]
FMPDSDNPAGDSITSYIEKSRRGETDSAGRKSIDVYEKPDSRYFILHLSSPTEYLNGRESLIKSGFVYDAKKDISKEPSMLFQKENVSIESTREMKDSVTQYTFKLRERKIPDSIAYAEDLLQFDSHEFLLSYFGKKNVIKDMYYFSEKDLKKCSVLFEGTNYRAVFVWGDENNLNNLSYILVSNVVHTKGEERTGMPEGNNEWGFHSGIHLGMPVKDILRLNEMDFYMYGSKSDLAFMVKPEITGKINFKKTAIMFNCNNCFDNEIFNQDEVSALDVAKANLPLTIFTIIIYP